MPSCSPGFAEGARDRVGPVGIGLPSRRHMARRVATEAAAALTDAVTAALGLTAALALADALPIAIATRRADAARTCPGATSAATTTAAPAEGRLGERQGADKGHSASEEAGG